MARHARLRTFLGSREENSIEETTVRFSSRPVLRWRKSMHRGNSVASRIGVFTAFGNSTQRICVHFHRKKRNRRPTLQIASLLMPSFVNTSTRMQNTSLTCRRFNFEGLSTRWPVKRRSRAPMETKPCRKLELTSASSPRKRWKLVQQWMRISWRRSGRCSISTKEMMQSSGRRTELPKS